MNGLNFSEGFINLQVKVSCLINGIRVLFFNGLIIFIIDLNFLSYHFVLSLV